MISYSSPAVTSTEIIIAIVAEIMIDITIRNMFITSFISSAIFLPIHRFFCLFYVLLLKKSISVEMLLKEFKPFRTRRCVFNHMHKRNGVGNQNEND